MDSKRDILALLRSVADGTTTPERAMLEFKRSPFEDLAMPRWTSTAAYVRERQRSSMGKGKHPIKLWASPPRWGREDAGTF